jgi:hypothetical protein
MTEKELTIFFIAFNLSSLLLFWKEGRRNIVMIVSNRAFSLQLTADLSVAS